MNRRSPAPDHARPERLDRAGVAAGIAAYVAWGIIPIYFRQMAAIDAWSIVAHRIVWSIPFLIVLLAVRGKLDALRRVFGSPKTLAFLALTAALVATNWLVYIYAVTSGHILAGSLGYYLNPLVNVLLARLVLDERLDRRQWVAIAIAAAGVSALALGALGQLWISLVLGVTFSAYGLLRKMAPVDAVTGLTVETILLVPIAGGWLLVQAASGISAFGGAPGNAPLLLMSGIVTAIPLLLFTSAARKLPYATLGMLQFLSPTIQFAIAVLLYDEPFTTAHAIAFGAIWTALLLYVSALWRHPRLPTPPE